MRMSHFLRTGMVMICMSFTDAIHTHTRAQQHILQEQQQAVSISNSAFSLQSAIPQGQYLGLTTQGYSQADIESAYCFNTKDAITAFLDQKSDFKCSGDTFKDANNKFASTKFRGKTPIHWGVVLMHVTPANQVGGGLTYVCGAANADEKTVQGVKIPHGEIRYVGPNEQGGGDHTEHICLDLFGRTLLGDRFDGKWAEKPDLPMKPKPDNWPANRQYVPTRQTDEKFRIYADFSGFVGRQAIANSAGRVRLSFCTQKPPCEFCQRKIYKFIQGLTYAGYNVDNPMDVGKGGICS